MKTYKTLTEFNPDWIVHPGEIVADVLKERNINAQIFAMEMKISFDDFSIFLLGEENSLEIDEAIAENFSKSIGSSKSFWLNLQHQYAELKLMKLI